MKRALVSVLIFISTVSLYSQSKGFSNWSFFGEIGYNYLDGDVNQNLTSIFPSSFGEIGYGGGIEYGLTPIWGLSLDFQHFPLKGQNTFPERLNINTNLYSGNLNATINFSRLIFPQSKSKFHVNGSLGIGVAYYEFSPTYRETGLKPNDVLANKDGRNIGMAGSIPFTISTEYNISKPIALGLKVHYRAFTKDNLEGMANLNWKGVTNDYIAAGSLYLRYKFNSTKKDHVRNISWEDFAPNLALATALEAKKETDDLKNKLDDLDKKVGDIDDKVNDLIPRVENLEKFIANNGPDTDKDGVPDIRDKEPNTAPNTAVDFWGISLADQDRQNGPELPAIYFDFDSFRLDEPAIVNISKIGIRMLSDPTLMVEIIGTTDYVGGAPYNFELSRKRAETVKKALVKIWEVSPDRIITSWKGRINSPTHRYRLNRRCEILYSK